MYREMKTQIEEAREGTITPRMEAVAAAEGIEAEDLRYSVAVGEAVIMTRGRCSVGIGHGMRTKVNVNLGTSTSRVHPEEEVEKARIAALHGADTITDLSTGGDITAIRQDIFAATTLPVTTVPIYQTAAEIGVGDMTAEDILATLRHQAEEGVSSFVLHVVSREMIDAAWDGERIMGVVSKGGSMTAAYMLTHDAENPFVEHFDEVLAILREHDIVLSLGNTMRSGCIHDEMDEAQKGEMRQNARLAAYAHEHGVQTIVEGLGGHVRADRIPVYLRRYREHSPAPLFVAGPLPTDTAVGYDHIAGCVGASIASGAGADYLCYLTPAEHLSLPTPDQVRAGLIAFRIAAHIGDSIKYGMDDEDLALARSRSRLDWEGQVVHAIDPETARALAPEPGPCTMCGDFCAVAMMKRLREQR
ncbi:Thiamine biosynthesis protein thiC [Methanoculleus bourgensis]|jgi:phosphomethylpyrimidine synthase|nr:phosphomethylpyrimidine synthase [Methanoculleus bourgensis]SAI89333.1 Thiamine biosynthesis protein thiC [Methanoculleus bourgensis]